MLLASEEALKEHGLKPLARLVGWSYVGVDPSIMGIGPVPAIRNLLSVTGNKLQDIDLIEVRIAFTIHATLQIADMVTIFIAYFDGGHPINKNIKEVLCNRIPNPECLSSLTLRPAPDQNSMQQTVKNLPFHI